MTSKLKILSHHSLHRLATSLHFAFHQDTQTLIHKLMEADSNFAADPLAIYDRLLAKERIVTTRATTYLASSDLAKAIDTRRNYAGVLRTVVRCHLTNPLADKAEAAKGLRAVLAPFDAVGRRQYVSAIQDVKAMVAVLKHEKFRPWVAALGLEREVAELEAVNLRVDELVQQKSTENSARSPQTDVQTSPLRREVDAAYARLMTIIEAHAIAAPSEALKTFVLEANGVADTYKSFIHKPKAQAPAAEKQDGVGEGPKS